MSQVLIKRAGKTKRDVSLFYSLSKQNTVNWTQFREAATSMSEQEAKVKINLMRNRAGIRNVEVVPA